MKTDIDELGLIESTESDLARSIVNGGWIEAWVWCPVKGCKDRLPHRHYICKKCGGLDFAGLPECRECYRMEQIHRLGRRIADWKRRYGMSLHRMGLAITAFSLAVLSTWRIKT